MTQTGYYLGMLASGAGALAIAARFSWFAAYATMAALMVVGMLTFLLGPEPIVSAKTSERDRIRLLTRHQRHGWKAVEDWLSTAVIGPFADFMRRKSWLLVLLVILDYKLGEGMAAVMSTPLYISLHFSLNEIAVVSKLFGPVPVILGALLGGVITVRFGFVRSLIFCGVLQALGNLTYVLQAVSGHRIGYLALCVTAQNLTSGMAGTALVSYISSLCSPEFTATQYALLASLALLGRTSSVPPAAPYRKRSAGCPSSFSPASPHCPRFCSFYGSNGAVPGKPIAPMQSLLSRIEERSPKTSLRVLPPTGAIISQLFVAGWSLLFRENGFFRGGL